MVLYAIEDHGKVFFVKYRWGSSTEVDGLKELTEYVGHIPQRLDLKHKIIRVALDQFTGCPVPFEVAEGADPIAVRDMDIDSPGLLGRDIVI